eukprot:jgi/Botrbrau1/3714/Bobra.0363s0001.1
MSGERSSDVELLQKADKLVLHALDSAANACSGLAKVSELCNHPDPQLALRTVQADLRKHCAEFLITIQVHPGLTVRFS